MPPSMKGALRLLAIWVVSTSASLDKVECQTSETTNWQTVTSESDVADTPVYTAKSDFGGRHYEATIYGRNLEGIRKWEEGKEPPLSVLNARTIAQNAFQKQFPQFSKFKEASINFIHLSLVDDWIIEVEFNGTDWAAAMPGAFEDRKIDVLILLDGRVITPK